MEQEYEEEWPPAVGLVEAAPGASPADSVACWWQLQLLEQPWPFLSGFWCACIG